MNTHKWLICTGLVLAAFAFEAGAEQTPGHIALWDLVGPPVGGHGSFSRTEFDPRLPGREPAGIASSCQRTTTAPPDGPVTSVVRTQRVYASAETGQIVGTFNYTIESGPYLLSTMTRGVLFYQENGLAVSVPGGFTNIACSQFPFSRRLGLGIAEVGKSRVYVVSEALIGSYSTYVLPLPDPPGCPIPPCPGPRTDASTFYLGVFDTTSGTLLWERSWPGVDAGGWSPSTGRSAVTEGLSGDKYPEVRVVRQRFVPAGSGSTVAHNEFNATFYDLLSGSELRSVSYEVPVP